MNLAGFNQFLYRSGSERCDPVNSRQLSQIFIDEFLCDHTSVSNEHHRLDTESFSHLLRLTSYCLGIRRISWKHGYRNRASLVIGEQAIVDLQFSFFAVSVVSKRGQRTGDTLEIARGKVVKDHAAFSKVLVCQLLLDPLLSL